MGVTVCELFCWVCDDAFGSGKGEPTLAERGEDEETMETEEEDETFVSRPVVATPDEVRGEWAAAVAGLDREEWDSDDVGLGEPPL